MWPGSPPWKMLRMNLLAKSKAVAAALKELAIKIIKFSSNIPNGSHVCRKKY